MSETKPEATDEQLVSPVDVALRGGTTQIYANGFALGMTNADTFVLLQMFGKPVAIVSLSYTLAKTLALKLTDLVQNWEKGTQQKLATTDDIDQAFKLGKK